MTPFSRGLNPFHGSFKKRDPRIPNLSPTIRVYSTLGRFLKHGRIFRFENAGDPLFFIGSADWMRRNLDKKMETITPVFDEGVKKELEEILKIY